jgi:hypothetical protein
MVESRCGIFCSQCEYLEQCGGGCTKISKPFWGDSCSVKDCCEGRGHDHCGQCSEFPCELLNEFAYDKEQGDDGKRIRTCRRWFAEDFIKAVAKQNADALCDYFTPDAIICWHDSNEQFTVDEYIRANCEYPSDWNGEVLRVEKTEDGMIVVTKMFSDESTHLITAFVKLAKGKICRLDEYYSDYNDCEDIPDWRKEMKIGKPIGGEGK